MSNVYEKNKIKKLKYLKNVIMKKNAYINNW